MNKDVIEEKKHKPNEPMIKKRTKQMTNTTKKKQREKRKN